MSREITAKKLIRIIAIVLFFAVIVGYGIWRSRDLLFGIRLSVSGISDGMSTTEPLITFSGVARHATAMDVDGTSVPLAQDGTWTDTFALLPGYNVLTISAADKFGRTISQRFQIYYNEPITPTTQN